MRENKVIYGLIGAYYGVEERDIEVDVERE